MVTNLTKEELNEIYYNDLAKLIRRGDKQVSRVRHPKNWQKIPIPTSTMMFEAEHIAKTWVWSDLHFGHKNIIRYSERPYTSIPEMNDRLVDNFNSCVGENDISIWVGDVAFMRDDAANEILSHCNGYKILVVGNHDFYKGRLKQLNFDETHFLYTLEHPDVDLVFTHYPIEEGLPWPYINVHGHIHNNSHAYETPQHINVCCEFHDFKPVPLETIIRWAKSRVMSHDQ